MNRDSAKKLFEREKFKFLRWDANFDQALLKTPDGRDQWVRIKGDKESVKKLLKSLKKISPASKESAV